MMTPKEVYELARQTMRQLLRHFGCRLSYKSSFYQNWAEDVIAHAIRAAIAQAVAAEREACAGVADAFARPLMSAPIMTTESAKMAMAEEIAAAIRARGEDDSDADA